MVPEWVPEDRKRYVFRRRAAMHVFYKTQAAYGVILCRKNAKLPRYASLFASVAESESAYWSLFRVLPMRVPVHLFAH